MNNTIYKKTFWMNIVISLLFILGLFMYFFVNVDYVEVTWLDKTIYVVWGCLLTSTITTFYKNDIGTVWKISVLFNLIILLGGLILFTKGLDEEYVGSIPTSLLMFIFSGINLKSLYQLKSTNNYLDEIPYSFFVTLILISIFFLLQPYLPQSIRILRLFITIGLIVMMGLKFKNNRD